MLAVVVHDIVGCDECRYISTGLLWEVWIDVPVVSRTLGTVDGLVYLAWTAVVGSDYQSPVIEDLIEITQVVGCSIRCFHRVAAFIYQ